MHVDEASHWDTLHARIQTLRIYHSLAYSDGKGCTNQVESCSPSTTPTCFVLDLRSCTSLLSEARSMRRCMTSSRVGEAP